MVGTTLSTVHCALQQQARVQPTVPVRAPSRRQNWYWSTNTDGSNPRTTPHSTNVSTTVHASVSVSRDATLAVLWTAAVEADGSHRVRVMTRDPVWKVGRMVRVK